MKTQNNTPGGLFADILGEMPQAWAWVKGNHKNPELTGMVRFFATPYGGVVVEGEFFCLPESEGTAFYAMHIHEVGDCTEDFQHVGGHYNPRNREHPYHAGDLLPLMAQDGYAWLAFYDPSINIEEIMGRSVIVHENKDDFTTQPSGGGGEKIGCGVIEKFDETYL